MFLTMKVLTNVRGAGPKLRMWSSPSSGERAAILLSLAFSLCFFAVCGRNHPPTTPDITGLFSSRPGDTAELSATSTDQDDDLVSYLFAWGDTSGAVWSPDYPSGVTVTRGHLYAESGAYAVRSRARDDKGAESDWSAIETLRVGIFPPGIPTRPVGPAVGLTGVAYRCSTCATSPYGESLLIQFDWGGNLGNWAGPVASDSPYVDAHVFNLAGTYVIRARAGDSTGLASPWSDSIEVTITCDDTTAPTCELTSPADSAKVNGIVPMAAAASDSVGVELVEFYADGSLVGTDSSSPYSASWDASGEAEGSWHSLSCVARDLAGNKGYSDTAAVEIAGVGQRSVYHGELEVPARSRAAVSFDAEVGDTLAGDVQVVSGGTLSSFMWLDDDNYQKYVANQAYTVLFQRDSFSQMSMSQEVPAAGKFYLVFVNAGDATVKCWARFVLE